MATSFSFDVFLSYNKQDSVRVRRLAERLRYAGMRVWFDEWVTRSRDGVYQAVERGLESSRTLVLCLSPAALGAEWIGLERNTVPFREPSNTGRRFIPLLLADCEIPETLRRYEYIDFRNETDDTFKKLLVACQLVVDTQAFESFVTWRDFPGHESWIKSVFIDPNGTWVASSSWDAVIKVWDLNTGACRFTLREYDKEVNCISVNLGRNLCATAIGEVIRIWDAESGKKIDLTVGGHSGFVTCVALDRDGRRLVSASRDSTLKIWSVDSGECILSLRGHVGIVSCLALATDNKRAASGSADGTVRIWSLETGDCLAVLQGHSSIVETIQFTPDGRSVASGCLDTTIKIWDLESASCVGTLEGQRGSVQSVAISPDHTLMASTGLHDRSIRLWDLKTGACLRNIRTDQHLFYPTSAVFSPDGSTMIFGTAVETDVFFMYYFDVAASELIPSDTHRYVNAKVVLVGESGVGKSGLAHRLSEDKFVQTDSTHGMRVWQLNLPIKVEDDLEREALLWDLAGQEDYRLIHQLFLDETALALLLFNPQRDDPFSEVEVWLRVLCTAVSKDQARDVAKLLVAARTDVGGVKVSQKKIDRFIKEQGIAGYLPTSAKRGDNCSDRRNGGKPSLLKNFIAAHIPWTKLPWTSTPRLLSDIKKAVIQMKEQKGIHLLRFAELAQRLGQALPRQVFDESDLRTAVTLLANNGLVIPFKFGDLVLLSPEILNSYASAVIRAAREHTDEIGCVTELAVFERTIDFEGVERLEPADEELLVRAMVQTFIDKSLCITEDTPVGRHLIFPSQYRRERPISHYPEIYVSYTFSGEWQTVYTTLVVRIWYSGEFRQKELWRNAVEFETSKGRTVGLLMERTGEGRGTISVFFEMDVPDELKVMFIEYVHRHLERYASEVRRDRRYVCPRCGKPVTDVNAVRNRIGTGKAFIYCQWCDETKVPLIDHIEQRLASDPVARRVLGMDEKATREIDTQSLEQVLLGHMIAICGEANQIFRELSKFDYGIDGEVEFKTNDGLASGRKIYVQLKSGASYLRMRKGDGKEIFDVKNPRHLEYWVNQPVDVYLVIRGQDEIIRWMNVTRYLKERSEEEKASRQIVFQGEKLDSPAVWRVRDHFFR